MKKLLFTPGPLSTSATVKEAMLQDMGSRDNEFLKVVSEIRNELLELAHVSKEDGYECVIMQGSGTFGVEAVISSVIGAGDKLLVLVNGSYGERIAKIAMIHHLNHEVLQFKEDELIDIHATEVCLQSDSSITHIACIHSETTTGSLNPIKEIGLLAKKYNKVFIVDAMSSFGGVEMDLKGLGIDFLISSSNKCIESVPGFSFILCKRDELLKAKDHAHTLTLDLYDQWIGLEKNGQFRFTPSTHSLMAFHQALKELAQEGGIPARARRYAANKKCLDEGMAALGIKQYLPPGIQGHIITSFLYPDKPNFNFNEFYNYLNDRGFVIYPGKLSKIDAFRIGNIGQIFPEDIRALVKAIEEALR